MPPLPQDRALEERMPGEKECQELEAREDSGSTSAEVWLLEENGTEGVEFWESLKAKPPVAQSWKTSVDVQQQGFSDTHATGNQQRHGEKSKTPVTVVQSEMSPTHRSFPVFAEEVLSVETDSVDFGSVLAASAVPDTACRRTLIGEYTLSRLERHLMKQGYKVRKIPGEFSFRFGNSGTLVSREI